MKKVVKIVVVLAALVLVLASCSQHLCPAYTSNDAENTENVQS